MIERLRRRLFMWRIRRSWQAATKLAKYQREQEHPYRIIHGERPRMTGYRRR